MRHLLGHLRGTLSFSHAAEARDELPEPLELRRVPHSGEGNVDPRMFSFRDRQHVKRETRPSRCALGWSLVVIAHGWAIHWGSDDRLVPR